MTSVQNKRKRESMEVGSGRNAPGTAQNSNDFQQQYMQGSNGMDNSDSAMDFTTGLDSNETEQEGGQSQSESGNNGNDAASNTAAAAMAHYHTMTVPQSTEQHFMDNPSNVPRPPTESEQLNVSEMLAQIRAGGGLPMTPDRPKPAVGTDEWNTIRKNNHKEVERRRRETINEGINELAKIVPGCDKNKGSILQRAVQFITQLKENETQNIEKWTLEKLLTEQAIAELSTSCDKLKAECQRAWSEVEQWKKAAQNAGASIDESNGEGDGDGDDADE